MDASSLRQLRLSDGRALTYAEFGDPRGRPLFYFHGFPGSRLEALLAEPSARRLGVRIVAPDRPGFGGSDPRPLRSLSDWADDVVELADALGIERFPIVGVSGGGPYALACAFRIPERLSAVGVVSSLGPLDAPGVLQGVRRLNRVGLVAATRAPWLIRPVLAGASVLLRRAPGLFMRIIAAGLSEPDRDFLARPEVPGLLVRSFQEAFRGGSRGPAWDLRVLTSPWPFELAAIRIPVSLWHGGVDVITPSAMGRTIEKALPQCDARWHPGAGHFSLVAGEMETILSTLLAGA